MDDDDSLAFAGAAEAHAEGRAAALCAGSAWGARPGRTVGAPRSNPLQRWWLQLCTDSRARVWQVAFAAVALVGLLLAFHSVVRGAVTQGEQRRAAVAARELAVWRCSTVGKAALRSNCLAALGVQPPVTLAETSGR